MSSQRFQEIYESIHDTGSRLIQYLHELREEELARGDDAETLQAIEGEARKALAALKEQRYQVAVIAAMKAG
ncbi:hypothetical protein, partial [Spirulina sp. 06S082]